ncbi:unnamed protein product [Pleuronectes platessa]|uniref:E3 ubiquitin-protein ligase RBBP6 n=1 Tax=Pleuronectes platessa TaxID=8262 RepID=A0A9N7V1Z7_PLEPL|nr:unnamed protein product [Pleuronectes platessa]
MPVVDYRFFAQPEYSTVTFDGLYITLNELKKQIMSQERLEAPDCDLQITNEQTCEEYTDDEAHIPELSSVIVKPNGKTFIVHRVSKAEVISPTPTDSPPSLSIAQLAKMANLYDANASEDDKIEAMKLQSNFYDASIKEAFAQGKKEHPPFVPHDQSSPEDDSGPIPHELMCPICNDLMTNAVVIPCCGYSYCELCIRMALLHPCQHADVSPGALIPNNLLRQRVNNYKNAKASEDDKIEAMKFQPYLDDASMNFPEKAVGSPPANYICYCCGKAGHYIQQCPMLLDKSVEVPKPVGISEGIPQSFMVKADPGTKGAMLTSSGEYAVPAIDSEAFAQGKKEHPPFVPDDQSSPEDDSGPIPHDLMCPICNDLMTNAVVIPCCGYSYCELCIRMALLYPCQHADVSPDTLIPNNFLRQLVNIYKNETSNTKLIRQQAQQAALPPPRLQISRQQDPLLANVTPPPPANVPTAAPQSQVKMFHQLRHLSLTYILLCTLPARANHPHLVKWIQNLLWDEAQKVTQELDHMVTIYHTSTRPHHSRTLIPTPLALYLLLQSVTRPHHSRTLIPTPLALYLLLQSVTRPHHSRTLIPTPLALYRPHHSRTLIPIPLALYLLIQSPQPHPYTSGFIPPPPIGYPPPPQPHPHPHTSGFIPPPPIGDPTPPQPHPHPYTSGFIPPPPIGYPPPPQPYPPSYTFGFIFLPPFGYPPQPIYAPGPPGLNPPLIPPGVQPPLPHLGPPLSQPPLSKEYCDRRRHQQDKSQPFGRSQYTRSGARSRSRSYSCSPSRSRSRSHSHGRSYPRSPYSRHTGRSYRRSRSRSHSPLRFPPPFRAGPWEGAEGTASFRSRSRSPGGFRNRSPGGRKPPPRGRPPYELKGPSPGGHDRWERERYRQWEKEYTDLYNKYCKDYDNQHPSLHHRGRGSRDRERDRMSRLPRDYSPQGRGKRGRDERGAPPQHPPSSSSSGTKSSTKVLKTKKVNKKRSREESEPSYHSADSDCGTPLRDEPMETTTFQQGKKRLRK